MSNRSVFRNTFLLFPFSGCGFLLGNYLLSYFSIFFFLIVLIKIRERKFNKKLLATLTVIALVFFGSSFFRYPINSFFPSLIILLMTLMIFLNSKGDNYLRTKDLILGIKIIAVYCFFELTIGNSLPEYWKYFENLLGLSGDTQYYRGIRRLRGAFLEPSVFAIALNTYLFILNHSKLSAKFKFRYSCILVILIILTFSSSALLLFLVNLSFLIYRNIFGINQQLKKYAIYSIILIPLGVLGITKTRFIEPLSRSVEKIQLIQEVILSGNLTGSVGYRVHSILVPFQYIQESSSYINKLLGTGYSNYSDYLISKYHFADFSGFSDGSIGNILSAILLSTGILGLITFLIFIWNIISIPSQNSIEKLKIGILVICYLLIFGDVTSSFIWFNIYLLTRFKLE